MGMTDINNAAGAQNALTARMNGFLDSIDADIATRQAAYAALAGDLTGIVSQQMNFTATVDPDEAAPTNVDGGVFNSLVGAINAAPFGSVVVLSLANSKTHPMIANVNLGGRLVFLQKTAGGNNPVLAPQAWDQGTYNYFYGFGQNQGGFLHLTSVDVLFPGKSDPALPWANGRSLVAYTLGGRIHVGARSCTITGTDGEALASGYVGGECKASLYNVTFDGPVFALRDMANSVGSISKFGVTLTNGAALLSGGSLVTGNVIQS